MQYCDVDGIQIYDTYLDERSRYESECLESLECAEATHFWFNLRRQKICSAFQTFVSKNASVLEIGGGTGYVAVKLQELGYDITMGDIHLNGLLHAKKKGVRKLCQFNLFQSPFVEKFDAICLFDVLEHMQDDQSALSAVRNMLKDQGRVLVTVPAHQWLWSRDDVIAGHYRRYTKKQLSELFVGMGFKILSVRYFFRVLTPLLLLRSYLRKDRRTPLLPGESIDLSINNFINATLEKLTKLEEFCDPFLPNIIGGSLLVVAEKILSK